jgi:methylase of polypeptide subunit release factors
MSIELYEAGFHYVDGVDYSENAIDLANKLAKNSDITDLNFFKCDILSPLQPEFVNKYMVCVDKVTYDAISLSKDKVVYICSSS